MTAVHPTAIVASEAQLGKGVEVGPYSVIGPCVTVGDNCRIMSHVVLDGRTKIGANCVIFPFACIGTQTQDLKYQGGATFVEIGDGATLREYVTVNSGTKDGETTRVGSGCLLMAYSHVAHACRVEDGVIMANCATLAGEVVVEEQAIIGGLSAVHQFVRIGRLCMIGGCTRITQDCPPFMIIEGNPAAVRAVNSVGLKRKNVGLDAQNLLKQAHRILYRQNLSVSQALDRMRAELPPCPEIEHLISFIEKSERGIIK